MPGPASTYRRRPPPCRPGPPPAGSGWRARGNECVRACARARRRRDVCGRARGVRCPQECGASWTIKSDKKLTAFDYAKKAKKEEIVKWFERGGREEEDEEEEEDVHVPAETEAQRQQRIKVLKAGSENLATICTKPVEKPEASDKAASHIGFDPGPGPKPVWEEIKACRSRADLICVKLDKETVVDPSLWYCRHVKNLKLRMPPGVLTRLPPELAYLNGLTTLIVSHNSLTELPDELGKLLLLKNLDFSDNEVEKLPNAVQNLQHLEVLDACRNSLQASSPPNPPSTLSTHPHERPTSWLSLSEPWRVALRTDSEWSLKCGRVGQLVTRVWAAR